MTEADYFEHLDAVANYLNGWGSTTQVREYIVTTRERPRLGKAVSVPLDLGERASEWLLDEFWITHQSSVISPQSLVLSH